MSYKEAHFLEPVPATVVAIEIGRSTSGFAFSFQKSKDLIDLPEKEGGNIHAHKVPSVLLLDSHQSFKAFGFDAIETYVKFSRETREKCYYIESFKRSLLNARKLTHETETVDSLNRNVNLFKIYILVIEHFKQLAINAVKDHVPKLALDDVLWLLPVASQFSDPLRHFMHDAATAAGIPKDRLRIVTEIDCAMLYFQENASNCKINQMKFCEKVILLDIRGEDALINVEKKINEKETDHMHDVVVPHAGGDRVTQEMMAFVRDLVGSDVWENIKHYALPCYAKLLQEVEMAKVTFSSQTLECDLDIDYSLLDVLKRHRTCVESLIERFAFKHFIRYDRVCHKLFVRKQLMESFFLPTVNLIKCGLNEILYMFGEHTVKKFFIFGGCSESSFVIEEIRKDYKNVEIIVPRDTALTVISGAVLMGRLQKGVEEKIARFSYGVPVAVPFIKREHPENLKKTYDGEDWCENVFMKIIERGQRLRYGDRFVLNIYSTAIDPELKHTTMDTLLVMSKLRNPKFCTKNDACSVLGKVSRTAPANGWPKIWKGEIHLVVKDNHFVMEIVNKTTGEISESRIGFM